MVNNLKFLVYINKVSGKEEVLLGGVYVFILGVFGGCVDVFLFIKLCNCWLIRYWLLWMVLCKFMNYLCICLVLCKERDNSK